MYDVETRQRALALVAQGRSLNSVSKQTGISRAAIRSWQARPTPRLRRLAPCARCRPAPGAPDPADSYAYVLGLYLGDGCITRPPQHRTASLRITLDDAWPGVQQEAAAALRAVFPDNAIGWARKVGCHDLKVYSKHLTCLFPQHGPGKKHERPIALEAWQQTIVTAHPWEFIRGLIHSDGSRITNWTEKMSGGQRKRYEYPRYFFTNSSADIIALFTDALDRVGVEWKSAHQSRVARNISVSRKASVALMDLHVGPKH
ncbi:MULTISPECIES: transcriptional regulator [Streptomyces]|uniref:Transcriptional regulator n=2 Tax=Streptomyces TaxID=1883 RepID=A0ABU4KIP3_9ACTN|nr:transcriptional regulator [Streptomyces roseolus]MDX2297665.1 transcriptional regulator [Streptomyces roseolus]